MLTETVADTLRKGGRVGVLDAGCRESNRLPQIVGTITTEFVALKDFRPTFGASKDESCRTLPAELLVLGIVGLALRAIHPGPIL